jgi:hypothetical protein
MFRVAYAGEDLQSEPVDTFYFKIKNDKFKIKKKIICW